MNPIVNLHQLQNYKQVYQEVKYFTPSSTKSQYCSKAVANYALTIDAGTQWLNWKNVWKGLFSLGNDLGYGASSLSNKHHLVIMIIPGYMQHRTKLSTSLDRKTWKNHKNSQISLFQSMYWNSIFHKSSKFYSGFFEALIFFRLNRDLTALHTALWSDVKVFPSTSWELELEWRANVVYSKAHALYSTTNRVLSTLLNHN